MANSTAYPGVGGLLPNLLNPLDMGKYEGNPNYEQDDDLIGFKPPMMQTMDVQKYYYKGEEKQGSSTYISALKNFLESQNKGNLFSRDNSNQVKIAPGNPGLVDRPGGEVRPPITAPSTGVGKLIEAPDYTEKFSGYDTKIGGFDNQFKDIIGRLDKLEQGIGGVSSTPTTPSSPLDGGVFSVYQGNNSRGY